MPATVVITCAPLVDLADPVVRVVGDEEVPGGVHRNTGAAQSGGGGRAVIAAVAGGPAAGDGGDHARGVIHLANPAVARVGDEEVPGGVHRDATGGRQSAAVAGPLSPL